MTHARVATGRAWMIAAALAVAACAMMESREPPPSPFFGTRWEAVLELPLKGQQPYLQMGDGRVEGFGGCNNFTGRYVQDAVGARAIGFGGLSTSKRLCDAATSAAETRFLEILQYVSSYAITGDTLVMSGSAGTLRFRAPPADKKKP
jgi:heat shock protein HslJ